MTIQQLTSNQPTADISSSAPDAPISESVIAQLAAEFFSALPKQNHTVYRSDGAEQNFRTYFLLLFRPYRA